MLNSLTKTKYKIHVSKQEFYYGKVQKTLNHIFIDGLSGMALGLFSTLIVGTIIQQIGNFIPGSLGEMIFVLGKVAAAMTSAGIGVGVAYKF